MFVIAHNIRSLHNVGAIFRSADAFNVERLYLTGFTGIPPRKEIAKTSLGSENRIAWEYRKDVFELLAELKQRGVIILAFETGEGSRPITDISVPYERFALIFGNEVNGLEKEIIETADVKVEIPMPGHKRSLNVSVAAGIAMFALGIGKR